MSEASTSFPFPVLGGYERMDYVSPCAYKTLDWQVSGNDVKFRHQIEGDGLVSQLVSQGTANFACTLVMKETMYRRTFIADGGGGLSVNQSIHIEANNRSSGAPMILPFVAYKGKDKSFTTDNSMALDRLWSGQTFVLPKGAIIAMEQWREFSLDLGNLLKIKKDDHLLPGHMRVKAIPDQSGYFLVDVSPDLFSDIRKAKVKGGDKNLHLNSILTHALTAGFSHLSECRDDEEMKTCENFQSVMRRLQKNNIATWEDDDFDPLEAACFWEPHRLFESSQQENEDE